MKNKIRFLLIVTSFYITNSFAANDCLKKISTYVLDFSESEAGWTPLAIDFANNNCKSCSEQSSVPTEITKCMVEKLPEQKKQYEKAIAQQVITHGIFISQDNNDYSQQEVEQKVQQFYELCPSLKFDNMMASTHEAYSSWYDDLENCIENVICSNENVEDKQKCIEQADYQSQFAAIPAMAMYQTKLSDEDANGKVSTEEISFEEESVITPKKTSKSKDIEIAPISEDLIIASTSDSETKKVELGSMFTQANFREMGCPDNVEFKLEAGKAICISPSENRPQTLITHMDQLKRILNENLYRDIAGYVAKRVWESYSMALLMDPKINKLDCSKGEQDALRKITDTIGFDTYMESLTNPAKGREKLNHCFNELGLGNRVTDLAKTASNMTCGKKKTTPSGPCAKDSDDKGKAKSNQIKKFASRAKMLGHLKRKLETLRAGKLIHQGKVISCGAESCEMFLDRIKECKKSGKIDQIISCNVKYDPQICIPQHFVGCPNPDLLPENQKLAYSIFSNFEETRNLILSKNPELSVIERNVETGKDQEVWEFFDPDKMYTQSKVENKFDYALRKSRQKKLNLIMKDICSDPKEFAQDMLLTNPNLINDFMRESKNKDVGQLLCIGISDAQANSRKDQLKRGVANLGLMALGMALALPTGGASMVYGLTAAGAAGAVGLAAYDLNNALNRLSREKGMFHGCLSEFDRISKAEDELDDATFWAAIDLAIAPTAFLGMSSLAKAKELQRLTAKAKIPAKSLARVSEKLKSALKKLKEIPSSQRVITAKDYGLDDFPGMFSKSGKLTKEGRKTVEQIQELERFGFSKQGIERVLRSCN